MAEETPASEQANSPETGSAPESPAVTPKNEESVSNSLPPEGGVALNEPPTPQPPLPFEPVFGEHGNPQEGSKPAAKRGIYVNADGAEQTVEIIAERKDGSVDILIPLQVGSFRRDGVRRKMDEAQTGDYLK